VGEFEKNETLNCVFTRIAKDELGFVDDLLSSHTLTGASDHFYNDSAFSNEISTHYMNLPFLYEIQPIMKKKCLLPKGKDQQYSNWTWLDIKTVSQSNIVHKYVRTYASWILNQKSI
jgi:colanic acid biosynthesis protein WcaH